MLVVGFDVLDVKVVLEVVVAPIVVESDVDVSVEFVVLVVFVATLCGSLKIWNPKKSKELMTPAQTPNRLAGGCWLRIPG